MKNFVPYAIVVTVILLIAWLVLSTQRSHRVFDERMSFNRRDKIPYGMYLAYRNLSHIFPEASVSVNRKAPSQWDSSDSFSGNQALIIISPSFRANEIEMRRLLNFVKSGNSVFISTAIVSYDVQNILHSEVPDAFGLNYNLSLNNSADSFSVSLVDPPFATKDEYGCPGKRFESYFSKYDPDISTVMGNGIYILPDFIHLKAGKGSLYVHLTPLAFSNYFLLQGENINYYSKVLSLIPGSTKKVIWDEYFMARGYSGNGGKSKNRSVLSALMSQRSFRTALWLLIILLALFILQEMRRKQRIIPVLSNPRNDSLEFVRTVGRLYHEKKDNKNLSHKMAAYFLEHIRNRYKISTTTLDEEFIGSLQRKTAQPENNIRKIISFINNIDEAEIIDDEKLADFHKQLEEFYSGE